MFTAHKFLMPCFCVGCHSNSPRSLQGAVRWETLGTRLSNRAELRKLSRERGKPCACAVWVCVLRRKQAAIPFIRLVRGSFTPESKPWSYKIGKFTSCVRGGCRPWLINGANNKSNKNFFDGLTDTRSGNFAQVRIFPSKKYCATRITSTLITYWLLFILHCRCSY